MATDLKPCPFCGGEAKLASMGGTDTKAWWVECRQCYAQTAAVAGMAHGLWNRRVPDPLLKEMADCLDLVITESALDEESQSNGTHLSACMKSLIVRLRSVYSRYRAAYQEDKP